MSVDAMLREVPYSQIVEWLEDYKLERWGEERIIACLCKGFAAVCNRLNSTVAVAPSDFWPKFTEDKTEDGHDFAKRMAAAGLPVVIKNRE